MLRPMKTKKGISSTRIMGNRGLDARLFGGAGESAPIRGVGKYPVGLGTSNSVNVSQKSQNPSMPPAFTRESSFKTARDLSVPKLSRWLVARISLRGSE